jgi:hypothetical protein
VHASRWSAGRLASRYGLDPWKTRHGRHYDTTMCTSPEHVVRVVMLFNGIMPGRAEPSKMDVIFSTRDSLALGLAVV